MDTQELGRSLRLRRQHLGLRQDELAELAEVSERFVRELEHGNDARIHRRCAGIALSRSLMPCVGAIAIARAINVLQQQP